MARSSIAGSIVLASFLVCAAAPASAGGVADDHPPYALAFAAPQDAKPRTPLPASRRSQSPAPSGPAKPTSPLTLKPPPAPSPMLEGTDLRKVPAQRLAGVARRLYDEKKYPQAIQVLHHAIAAGADGGYDLACDYALAENVDAAFYWLQKSALDEGIDAIWAGEDSDLEILRKDRRWAQVAPFLAACNAYWAKSGNTSVTLVVPSGYQPGKPIGVLVGMHGRGADPEGFVNKEAYQDLADELKMAIVGVSGTVPRGRRSYVWSENPVEDAAHIRRALAGLKDKLTVTPGQNVLFGFSQGAQMAFEVAFANPAEYAGAIVMSPGTTKRVTLRELSPGPANKKQAFVCTCGAQEQPGNVLYTRADAEFATKAGSRVELKLYDGVAEHRFPADFNDAFPGWVRFVRGKAPAK